MNSNPTCAVVLSSNVRANFVPDHQRWCADTQTSSTARRLSTSWRRLLLLALVAAVHVQRASAQNDASFFASIAGYYSGNWSSRLGTAVMQGDECLPDGAPDIMQQYTLFINADGSYDRTFDSVSVNVTINGTATTLVRPGYLEQGSFDSYNATSEIANYHISGDTQEHCLLLRKNADGTFTEATTSIGSACDSLPTNPVATCNVSAADERPLAPDYASVIGVGELSGACLVSEWSTLSACSASCGGGNATRSRTVLIDLSGNTACPVLTDAVLCNVQPCGDFSTCTFSDWSAWSNCSVTCGNGTAYRARAPNDQSSQNPVCSQIQPGDTVSPLLDYTNCR
jgi:hypothetical protein